MTKLISIIFILFLTACRHAAFDANPIRLDLDEEVESIPYSAFAKSVEYFRLDTRDSCLLSGIRRIYADLPYLFIEDEKKGGVFIFTVSGQFIKQINTYGNGPEEFLDITAFTVDPSLKHLCIHDGYSGKLMKYTYEGEFIRSAKNDVLIRDFAVFPKEQHLCIMPSYREGLPTGLWLQNPGDTAILRTIDNDVPKEDQFEFVYTFYNLASNGIYYYDRNWDRFSFVTPDSIIGLYRFDLKQRVPARLRAMADPGLQALSGYAALANFSYSGRSIAFTYFVFGDPPVFKWALLDQTTGQFTVSSRLSNDLDGVDSSQPYLYHLNDSLWARLVDAEDNDCTLTLQLLHLK